jgi:GNAT superfamily N-acetyltransferase
MLYVKSAYRGRGVARMLLKSAIGGSRDVLAVFCAPKMLKKLRDGTIMATITYDAIVASGYF